MASYSKELKDSITTRLIMGETSASDLSRETGISKRTYNRWKETDSEYIDKRTICKIPEPANKLTPEEKQEILEVVHSEKYSELPPSQIVPRLADEGRYKPLRAVFIEFLEKQMKWLTVD